MSKNKRKIRIDVMLSEDLVERLYEYVKKTSAKLRGGLSRTVEEAIKEYLDRHAGLNG